FAVCLRPQGSTLFPYTSLFRSQDLELTATEFALLRHLAEHAGRVLSRMDILSAVWDYDFDPHTNIVEVYIAYLRKKLERAGGAGDRKSTRLNSSHVSISYAVFC